MIRRVNAWFSARDLFEPFLLSAYEDTCKVFPSTKLVARVIPTCLGNGEITPLPEMWVLTP